MSLVNLEESVQRCYIKVGVIKILEGHQKISMVKSYFNKIAK